MYDLNLIGKLQNFVTAILYENNTTNGLELDMNHDMHILRDFITRNFVTVYQKKSKYIIFGKIIDRNLQIEYDNLQIEYDINRLEETSRIKYLGIY